MADNDDSSLGTIAKVGTVGSGLAILNKNRISGGVLNFIPGAGYLNTKLAKSGINVGSTTLINQQQSFGKAILSKIMALEELSPLHILRTLQLSNLIQPFTEIAHNKDVIHIASSAIRDQSHYYTALIDNANKEAQQKVARSLSIEDMRRGLFFENNILYGAGKDGKINKADVVMKDARLVMGSINNGEIDSPNRLLQKFANVIGSNLSNQSLKKNSLVVVGGKEGYDFAGKWTQSVLRYSAEIGFKTLDNPIAGVEELLGNLGAGETKLFESKAWNTVRRASNLVQMGTNGNYEMGLKESLKLSGKNIATRGFLAYLGYQTADTVARKLSPSDGIFSNGLAAGIGNLFAIGHMNFAKVWSDRFQGYKHKQEQYAPGSTSLLGLMAFPLAGALFGARVSYMDRMKTTALKGFDEAAIKFNTESSSDILKKVGIAREMKHMNKFALMGGIAGAALTLPFLPGALVGESSKELRDRYSGKKEYAERSTRGWLFGGGDIRGGAITTFAKDSVVRMNAEAATKVRYGSADNKKKMDPILHPFSYMRNPYQFEERNQKTMPYPVWGMDVSFGGFFGKAFQNTVGAIIKPDVVNPYAIKAMKQEQKDIKLMERGRKSSSPQSPPDPNSNALGDGIRLAGTSIYDTKSIFNIFHIKTTGKRLTDAAVESVREAEVSDTKRVLGITDKDSSLMSSGLMRPTPTASYDPKKESLALAYNSAADFTGLKGWTTSLAIKSAGFDPGVTSSKQLARSGEATSAARDLIAQNLGDLLGCFIPSSRVLTSKGYVEIQDILIGDEVLSKGGIYRPVKRVIKQPNREYTVVEITTKYGSFITCTTDHIIPSGRTVSTIKDRTAGELVKGDILIHQTDFGVTYDVVWSVYVTSYIGNVYDLEITKAKKEKNIEDINYYTIENIIVHNSGEFQRKILPTSAGSQPDRFNPLQNNAPSWLPSDPSSYFKDFSHGNMYSKVARGEERLPGVGYEALHPDMKNKKPEDYPDIYKLKILQDVARGSKEQVQMRRQVIQQYKDGQLNKSEKEMLGTILDQEQQLQHKKDFYVKPTGTSVNIFNNAKGSLWEVMRTHVEQSEDMLTPIRPGAKLLHARTAIEDYKETQLGGSDAAIWTNTNSHFIKPAANKLRASLPVGGTFIPQETREQYAVNEYFDKFEFLRARRNNMSTDRTVLGASMNGLNTKNKLLRFKAALTDEQKDYFDSFAKENSKSGREEIRKMLPEDVLRGYEQIWRNNDLATKAKKDHTNIQRTLAADIHRQTVNMSSKTGVGLSSKDRKKASQMVDSNTDNYVDQGLSRSERLKFTKDEMIRSNVAFKEASSYVKAKTGIPDSKFMGWDPRLTTNDLKIKTLSVGGADLKKYGFWQRDEERMADLEPATQHTKQVTDSFDKIRKQVSGDRRLKRQIEESMYKNGHKVTRVDTVDSNHSSFLFDMFGG